MLSTAIQGKRRTNNRPAITLVLALTSITACASQGIVPAKQLPQAAAEKMASAAQKDSEFPIVINAPVLKQLNRYVGTADGRAYMRAALRRMERHRSVVEPKVSAYRVPSELMAVPITESGYRNLESKSKGRAAGLWMFIKSSARKFGLRVDDQVDERLNIARETDAAMRYLKAENQRFKNWLLALLAYNMGDKKLQEGIDATGSRDPWVLIENGYEGDKDYLPKLMAAVLIMKNPHVVQ